MDLFILDRFVWIAEDKIDKKFNCNKVTSVVYNKYFSFFFFKHIMAETRITALIKYGS